MHSPVLTGKILINNNKPNLSGVTLVAVTSVARDATVKAMMRSLDQVTFGKALLLSDQPPSNIDGYEIEWQRIAPLQSKDDYSRFMLRRFHDYIDTPHALITQWDSFVLNGAAWDDHFLDYDYIGAPWPHFSGSHTVGNGGFSLRSKRLLEACAGLAELPGEAEDVQICRIFRDHLEQRHGLRFAPDPIAGQFAFERSQRRGTEFGFHGVFNMIDVMAPSDFTAVLSSLEDGVIGRIERRELLVKALKSRRWGIVWQTLAGRLKPA